MEIIINGLQACLKKNTSFEYISENTLFTGSDSYTLTITFPLKDCPQNIAIFGHIHRKDVEKSKVVFDCEIRDKAFSKSGTITVTQINEVEVKTQFLEGRSEQNFDDTFDDISLNKLNLGYPDTSERNPAQVSYSEACLRTYPQKNWVALPWVNNTSGNMQNAMNIDAQGNYSWASTRSALTYQPFLMYILNKICEVLEYTGHFEEIEGSSFKYLLICNTLPNTWSPWNFALALPHWSLTKFFEQLELLMNGEFSINHRAKTISFHFSRSLALNSQPVHIDKVVNKYTVEVAKEDSSEYLGRMNLAYADNDNRMWPYRSCQWYIDAHKEEAVSYDTLNQLMSYARDNLRTCGVETTTSGGRTSTTYRRGYPRGSIGDSLLYARDKDCYFIMWCFKAELVQSVYNSHHNVTNNYYLYTNRLEPVNQFGKRVADKDADDIELYIVPAWIDDTDETLGQCLFLECGELDSAMAWSEDGDGGNISGRTQSSYSTRSGSYEYDETDYDSGALAQTTTGRAIAKGEQEKDDAYFDCIYIGFWDGNNRHNGKLPRPAIDSIELEDDITVKYTPFSLRINKLGGYDLLGQPLDYIHDIDNRKKYTFSFFADEIPDPRALFYIEGGRYVCEKITATFHEGTGRSQLLKGEFYRVKED